MKFSLNSLRSGFTLLELLFSLAILFLILTISTSHWSIFTANQALSRDRLGVMALFEQARSLAVASESNSNFGIYLSTSTVYLFTGDTFNINDSRNNIYNLNSLIIVSSTTLSGGGNTVIFNRLSGTTNTSGTIRLSSVKDANASTTITLFASGVVQ